MSVYDFDSNGYLVIDGYAVLDEHEQWKLMKALLVNHCPFCYGLIAKSDKVCDRCLERINQRRQRVQTRADERRHGWK